MSGLNFDTLNADTKGQLACTLAALILADSKKDVSADEIKRVLKAVNVETPAHWPVLFGSALNGKNVAELVSGSGNNGPTNNAPSEAPAQAQKEEPKGKGAKVEQPKEEEIEVDMDMGDLFG